jgi:hypothetical protein
MITDPDPEPEVAVTVSFVPEAAPPALKVAIASPFVPVVPWVTVKSPADAVNVTLASLTSSFVLSFATAVIVATVLPSAAIVVGLAVRVIDVTRFSPPLLELLLLLELELELLLEPVPPGPVIVLPPQAESSQAAATAMIDNLRMSYILVRRLPFRDGN